MIQPMRANEALLADIQSAAGEPGAFHLWWLGQSGFLIQWEGRRLLIDPYLSDSLTAKYADTDKPHTRMTARVIDPRQLTGVDIVTSSHNHTDHLDAETLRPLLDANPDLRMVVPAANRAFVAERLEVDSDVLIGVDAGMSVTVAGMEIHGVPAAHEALETDDTGRHRFLGYVFRCGDWTIYHSGDTIHYAGMVEILRRWPMTVALLPINGRKPERRVAGNLWGHEAAALGRQIHAGCVIPCHYDMFTFNTATTDEFTHACQKIGQPYHVLQCGERWSWIAPEG